jgi:hypothetical protein
MFARGHRPILFATVISALLLIRDHWRRYGATIHRPAEVRWIKEQHHTILLVHLEESATRRRA